VSSSPLISHFGGLRVRILSFEPFKSNTLKFVVLYWCETWLEEHRLRASGKRIVKKMFGQKKEEVRCYWRKCDSEGSFYYSHNIIRVIK
jgi:hypothetical protein